MSVYGVCPWCGDETVQVDNPMRREVRHRRGQGLNCPGRPVDIADSEGTNDG